MKMSNVKLLLPLGALAFATAAFQNCSKIGFSGQGVAAESSNGSLGVGNPTIVCNPLGSSATSSANQGIQAQVFYVPQATLAMHTPANYGDMMQYTQLMTSTIFLPDLDVPTVPWTDGYSTDGSAPLTDSDGNPLLQYFGLNMQTQLHLASNDADGLYQFAVVSDDGAEMTSTADGSVLAGSLGDMHSTKIECGSTPVPLSHAANLPVNITYFQGPPTEIAFTVMWRHVASASAMDMSQCGKVSATLFAPSTPSNLSVIDQMKANGWEIIPAANYLLPSAEIKNPCASN